METTISREQICNQLNMSDNTFDTHLRELDDHGYISRTQQRKNDKYGACMFRLGSAPTCGDNCAVQLTKKQLTKKQSTKNQHPKNQPHYIISREENSEGDISISPITRVCAHDDADEPIIFSLGRGNQGPRVETILLAQREIDQHCSTSVKDMPVFPIFKETLATMLTSAEAGCVRQAVLAFSQNAANGDDDIELDTLATAALALYTHEPHVQNPVGYMTWCIRQALTSSTPNTAAKSVAKGDNRWMAQYVRHRDSCRPSA